MFRTLPKSLSTAALLLIAAFVSVTAPLTASANTPVVGEQYYTTYNFMFEKERHVTTNYWRGERVAINTLVTVKKLTKKKMILDIDGREITILNVKKFTKRGMKEIAAEMLSETKTSTRGKFRDDINSGNLRLGMTKEEVIKTRGYPPAHKTASTDANYWTYWASKFVQLGLAFEDGKLVRGRGLK